jgi:hypothetical protein
MNEILIRRRSLPEHLRYLAAKLREDEKWRESVALSLDVLALELQDPRELADKIRGGP